MSSVTVVRNWGMAKSWLLREIDESNTGGGRAVRQSVRLPHDAQTRIYLALP